LEAYATRHASALLGALAKRMPKTAHLSKDHKMTDLSVDQIVAGDALVVQPHEICPVDGEVIEGHGDMDESYLVRPFCPVPSTGKPRFVFAQLACRQTLVTRG
jgi:cation transport ATPase